MKGIIIILICTVISFSFAITADKAPHKHSILSNFLIPPAIAFAEIVLFIAISMITKNKVVRRVAVVLFCCYMLYAGVALHHEKGNWPLMIFAV